ncbi:MAG TPA: ectoine hydroxylase [Arenibaculum sp.]|nr:ectoine hydroxylase [Arenibaculum sp.]
MTMIQDIYPSRQAPEPGTAARQDPVVWGTAEAGPLSADELEFFDRQGYLWFPGIVGADEVTALKAELDRLWGVHADDRTDEVIREPSSDEIRSIFRIHETSPVMRRLIADPRLAGRARQILGSRVYVHQSRINYKPGFRGKEFYWHSDFETWHVEDGLPRMRALSCAIALSENTLFNGPVMIVPGSHRTYVQCVGETPDKHYRESLRAQRYGVPDDDSLQRLVDEHGIEMPTGPAGSVLFFDCNLMHGSNSNISPYARSNVFTVYNSVENTPVRAFGPSELRPHFLGSRDFTPTDEY